MKKSAWYNSDILPKEMIKGANAEFPGWKKLEYSEHFKVLDSIIFDLNISSIVDIGCGAGEVGRVYNNYKYCGCDLPHIIDEVSMIVNPDKNYVKFDAYNLGDLSFMREYDLILMNGFLSELENPLDFLKELIKYEINYILIHRQDFIEDKSSYLENYNTYGGVETTNSFINYREFLDLIKDSYDVSIKKSCGIEGSDKSTILLKKIKIYDKVI
jgi:SAM-dependent methyltransferase